YSVTPSEAIALLLESPFGGSWSSTGGLSFYGSGSEAFEAGIDYQGQHGTWAYTEYGSEQATREVYNIISNSSQYNPNLFLGILFGKHYVNYNSSTGKFYYVGTSEEIDIKSLLQGEGEDQDEGSAGGGLDDRFSNSEKATLGLAATGGSVQVTTELINRLSGAVKNADVVNFGKSVTKKFGFVGVGLTTYNSFSDGVFTTGDGARILLSGATFIPYVGWAYGAVDIGILMVTGTSVTDRVGVFVDEHWGPGPIRP
ncbi:MAG: hypothetical protein B6D64_12795, partial [Bacteroidetes bacterium 4484_276]